MSQREELPKKVQKIVVVFDVCSSTNILEDLLRTESEKEWRDLLINLKQFLLKKSKELGFEIYKFLGDGWIIIFDYNYPGVIIFNFIRQLSMKYNKLFFDMIYPLLETNVHPIGLTYGIDGGTLVSIIMGGRKEYIGRSLNIACRLQGSITIKDTKPQYKAIISKHLYTKQFKGDIGDIYYTQNVQRILKNIAGGLKYNCIMVELINTED